MKHTPGPWNTRGTAGHDRHGQSAVYAESGKDIAIVYDGAANANLIAAAPDLLAACKVLEKFVTALTRSGEDHQNRLVELEGDMGNRLFAARAAIAHAEGGAA